MMKQRHHTMTITHHPYVMHASGGEHPTVYAIAFANRCDNCCRLLIKVACLVLACESLIISSVIGALCGGFCAPSSCMRAPSMCNTRGASCFKGISGTSPTATIRFFGIAYSFGLPFAFVSGFGISIVSFMFACGFLWGISLATEVLLCALTAGARTPFGG